MRRNAAGLNAGCGILSVQFQKTKDTAYSCSSDRKGKQQKL